MTLVTDMHFCRPRPECFIYVGRCAQAIRGRTKCIEAGTDRNLHLFEYRVLGLASENFQSHVGKIIHLVSLLVTISSYPCTEKRESWEREVGARLEVKEVVQSGMNKAQLPAPISNCIPETS